MREESESQNRGISKLKLAVGAASLFLFVVGLKRSFRTEEGREILKKDAELEKPRRKEGGNS